MPSTIDTAGRVVIPRALRDELGWKGGEAVDIEVVDGSIVISPIATKMTLVQTDDGLVAVPEVDLPPLTNEIVQRTRDSVNR